MAKTKRRVATKTTRPARLRIEHRLCGECQAKVTFVITHQVDVHPNCIHFEFPEGT